MPRTAPPAAPQPGLEDDLLRALLADEVPGRGTLPRPARLRSATQQRQEALRGFMLRTWVDRALQIAERGLVVAAALAFVYWLADGYGRDWLHELRRAEAAQSGAPALTPTPPLPLATMIAAAPAGPVVAAGPAAPADPAAAAPSLPFTRPDDVMAATGAATPRDTFMAPQAVHTAPDLSDPRPRRLIMPALGADMGVYEVFVVDGEWQVAEYAAGFHNGSAMPGMVGNSVFSGHAGLRGAVFKDLYRLKAGDEVIVETATWRYAYRVRGASSVWPNQVEVMDPTPSPVLTLITCTNWDTQRLVVVADLVDARPL